MEVNAWLEPRVLIWSRPSTLSFEDDEDMLNDDQDKDNVPIRPSPRHNVPSSSVP